MSRFQKYLDDAEPDVAPVPGAASNRFAKYAEPEPEAKPHGWTAAAIDVAASLAGPGAKLAQTLYTAATDGGRSGENVVGRVTDAAIKHNPVYSVSRVGEMPETPEQRKEWAAGFVRSAAQGATFNWADEIEAAARGLAGGDREKILAELRDAADAFKKANPGSAIAGEIMGALSVPGVGTAKLASMLPKAANATVGARITTGGAFGLAEGAASGAGAAEHDRGTGATVGGVIGTAIGAGIPAVGAVARPLAETIGTHIPVVRDAVARARADRRIAGAVAEDAELAGRKPLGEVAHALRASPPPTGVADDVRSLATEGGENIRALAREASRGSPTAQRDARLYEDVVDAARPGRHEYDQTYRQIGPKRITELDTLIADRPAIRQANAWAVRHLQDAGLPVLRPGRGYTPEHLDQIDRALVDAISKAERKGAGNRAASLRASQKEVRDLLEVHAPEIMARKREYAHTSRVYRESPERGAVETPDKTRGALGLAVDIAAGRKVTASRKILEWLGDGGEREATEIARRLLTRFDDDKLADVLARIENMQPEARRTYIRGVLRVPVTTEAGRRGGEGR